MAARAVTILAFGLGLWLAACGGTTTVTPDDGGDASAPRDTATDRGGEDGPGDGPLPDGGGDAGPTPLPRFLSETGGGARLLSTNYRLELFVAPSRAPGSTRSPGYQLKLGPGALRNAR
ncbi:MAG: hypothetical protein HY906_07295 [Deltaproteobacteria bacterium]|nr:hypothetical protein [Deltaproteobacteria bacterium]